jgi:hypothetical protein
MSHHGYIPNQIIENPVSMTGSAKRIWPLGRGSHGWVAGARRTGVALLLVLVWVLVLAWYVIVVLFPLLWIAWPVYTLRRRHFIYDARRYGQPIG